MNNEIILSIVTPTYNRGELLKKCFSSLIGQSDARFEWIIVDDGSKDNTREIVAAFQKQRPEMRITYVYKENGGKHTALNASHPYIHGQYVLMLDSDDTLLDFAVQEVISAWDRYGTDPKVGMVTFLKGAAPDQPFAYAEQEGVSLDVLNHKRICVIGNDCCETIRAESFLAYPFPVFENEKFMSEGILWKQIGIKHSCVYVNLVIYIAEYLDGGLTRAGRALRIKNPRGGMLNSSMNMNPRANWKDRIKNGLLYDCYGFFARMKPSEIVFGEYGNRGMKLGCLFPGYLLYRYWKHKYGSS